MGRLGPELRHVEDELAAQIRRYHLRAQLGRLAAGVVGSVVLSLTRGGPGPLDWKLLGPVVAAAVWTQLAKQVPSVPWDLLRVRLGLPSGVAAAPPSGGSPGGGGGQ